MKRLFAFSWLSCVALLQVIALNLAHVQASTFLIDDEHPRHFKFIDDLSQEKPFLRLGKSAFFLLAEENWDHSIPGDGRTPGQAFIDQAYAEGFNTLRVFLMAWWRDSGGNLDTVTDADSKVTEIDFAYGSVSEVRTAQELPSRAQMTLTREINPGTGLPDSFTDPNGQVTEYGYDELGRLTLIDPPGSEESTEIVYAADAQHITVNRGASYSEGYTYDGFGRLILSAVPLEDGTRGESYIHTVYDALGRVTQRSDATDQSDPGQVTAWTTYSDFDVFGRPRTVTTPDGSIGHAYSGNQHRVFEHCSGETYETLYVFDHEEQLIEVEDALGGVFTYNRDALGGLPEVVHPVPGYVDCREFAYDSLGWLRSATHPESGTVTYGDFTCSGLPGTITDAEGKTVSISFDDLYRPTAKTFARGADIETISYYYDGDTTVPGTYVNPVNHLTAAVREGDLDSQLVWREFDAAGRNTVYAPEVETPEMGQLSDEIAKTYDTMGDLTDLEYPGGFRIEYTRSAATRAVMAVTAFLGQESQVIASGITYNPAGGVQSLTYGNGAALEIEPDGRNRPEAVTVELTGGTLLDLAYIYDDLGRIGSITYDGRDTDVFEYDGLGRLRAATVNGEQAIYEYDATGNMVHMMRNDADVFDYGDHLTNNRLPAAVKSAKLAPARDASGFLTDDAGVIRADYTHTYGWTPLDELQVLDNGTETCQYDAQSKRLLATDRSPMAITDQNQAVVWPGQTGGLPYEIHRYHPFGEDFDDLNSPGVDNGLQFTGRLLDDNADKLYLHGQADAVLRGCLVDESSSDQRVRSPAAAAGWTRPGCLAPIRYSTGTRDLTSKSNSLGYKLWDAEAPKTCGNLILTGDRSMPK